MPPAIEWRKRELMPLAGMPSVTIAEAVSRLNCGVRARSI